MRVLVLEGVKLLFEKNILLGRISEDESEAGLVRRILKGIVEDLVHGRAACRLALILGDHEIQSCAYMPLPPAIIPTSSNWLTLGIS